MPRGLDRFFRSDWQEREAAQEAHENSVPDMPDDNSWWSRARRGPDEAQEAHASERNMTRRDYAEALDEARAEVEEVLDELRRHGIHSFYHEPLDPTPEGLRRIIETDIICKFTLANWH